MSSSITNEFESSTPILVTGYLSTRQGQSIFHPVIGATYSDVIVGLMTKRRGTLRLVYDSEAESLRAEQMHYGYSVMTFSDSDIPSASMDYVVDGNLTRELDPDSRVFWIVSIDFQEVN